MSSRFQRLKTISAFFLLFLIDLTTLKTSDENNILFLEGHSVVLDVVSVLFPKTHSSCVCRNRMENVFYLTLTLTCLERKSDFIIQDASHPLHQSFEQQLPCLPPCLPSRRRFRMPLDQKSFQCNTLTQLMLLTHHTHSAFNQKKTF